MRKITVLVGFLLLSVAVWAQDAQSPMLKFAEEIKQADLQKHLEILASDEYEGRETGEKGQKMAAEYIRKHFQEIGLAGPVKEGDSPYYQSFTLVKTYMEGMTITQGEEKLELFKDFFPYGRSASNMDASVVFAGYGLETESYSDYKDLDVAGKIVMIAEGEPQKKDGTFWISGTDEPYAKSNTRSKLALAMQKGAAGVVVVYADAAQFEQRNKLFKSYYGRPSLGFDKEDGGGRGLILFTSTAGAAKMLGTKAKKFEKAIAKMDKKGVSVAGEMEAAVNIVSDVRKDPVVTENVLGYMEGTDLKDELLVITAHYDHVGIINGEIHNGADDDGSGTVTVLEVAQAFAKAKAEGHGPRRSILFMTVTGEEKGLLGSEYYSENPIFPLENTVVNLNTDMVGRIDPQHEGNPDYVYVIGSDMLSSDLHKLHEEVAKKNFADIQLDYTYNNEDDPNRYYYRSDHYNFAKNNIPVIFYFNGTHADYHKPTDTVEKIHFGKMEKIGRLNFCTAWTIANRDARLVVDKAVEK